MSWGFGAPCNLNEPIRNHEARLETAQAESNKRLPDMQLADGVEKQQESAISEAAFWLDEWRVGDTVEENEKEGNFSRSGWVRVNLSGHVRQGDSDPSNVTISIMEIDQPVEDEVANQEREAVTA